MLRSFSVGRPSAFDVGTTVAGLYIGWSDVTESMVTIRSPFCGYDMTQCVELNGEELSCYSNKIESVSLRKCPYDRWLSAVTVTNIYQSFTYKMAGKINWYRYGPNLCHCHPMCRRLLTESGLVKFSSVRSLWTRLYRWPTRSKQPRLVDCRTGVVNKLDRRRRRRVLLTTRSTCRGEIF